jgi:hypothetical protein
MGRPPKRPGGLGSVFQIRLSDAERAEYQAAAERAGVALAEWMRDRLSKAAKRESKRD